MRITKSSLWALAKLVVAAAISAILLIVIMNAAVNPVNRKTTTYTADFSDVSGLSARGDVRVRGVQVGKITSIKTIRQGDQALARVTFTADRAHPVTDRTELAVKYQNLTGIRYVDMVTAAGGVPVRHVDIQHTTPSFDITQLFNGLQPVLVTLNTDQINTISQNAITLLQGDGSGLAPMLDSIQKLGDYVHNREQVISTLVDNLARISDSLGGKSDNVIQVLHDIELPVDNAIDVLDEFTKTSIQGPMFMRPVDSIIKNLGFRGDLDVNAWLAHVFGSVNDFATSLRLLPATFGILQSPQLTIGAPSTYKCSHGAARLPDDVTMLLGGTGVVVCNP
ncbi:MlaD family protein [Jongsikchunia kroppenstedtii]|uniref:MlaD family protein n=1 Tax=Jongsikchunia kroppenstedtii TaxID=1121721 RepID=UPI00036861A6|nr:MlaD family protein [Jongsikchunia kroppenstedtii]